MNVCRSRQSQLSSKTIGPVENLLAPRLVEKRLNQSFQSRFTLRQAHF
jgi:hypothetical protein